MNMTIWVNDRKITTVQQYSSACCQYIRDILNNPGKCHCFYKKRLHELGEPEKDTIRIKLRCMNKLDFDTQKGWEYLIDVTKSGAEFVRVDRVKYKKQSGPDAWDPTTILLKLEDLKEVKVRHV